MILKEARITGQKFFHVFEDAKGVQFHEETTQQSWSDATGALRIVPKKEGFNWMGWSYVKDVYDTPTGDLEDGYFVEERTIRVKLVGCKEWCLKPEEVVSGELNAESEDRILKSNGHS